jgi:hypothetical protein
MLSAANLSVTSQPRLGSTNLLINGDMENGSGSPDAWRLYTFVPGTTAKWDTRRALTGKKSLYLGTPYEDCSGYWAQELKGINYPAKQGLLCSVRVDCHGAAGMLVLVGGDNRLTANSGKADCKVYYSKTSKFKNTVKKSSPTPLWPNFIQTKRILPETFLDSGWKRISIRMDGEPQLTENLVVSTALNPAARSDGGTAELWYDHAYLGIPDVLLKVDAAPDAKDAFTRIEVIDDTGTRILDRKITAGGRLQIEQTVPADAAFYEARLHTRSGKLFKAAIKAGTD